MELLILIDALGIFVFVYRSRTLSRQPSITVLQHKKQIALPVKADKAAAPTVVAGPNNVKQEGIRLAKLLSFQQLDYRNIILAD